MAEPNFQTMGYAELSQYADFAADWLDERGFSISNISDLRGARQDRGFLMGLILAWREAENKSVAEQNRIKGINGHYGRET